LSIGNLFPGCCGPGAILAGEGFHHGCKWAIVSNEAEVEGRVKWGKGSQKLRELAADGVPEA
jgi:hypothetical protein